MKKLIAYFSATGTTKSRAGELAKAAGADICPIEPETAYTSADLDWNDKSSRSSVEMKDESSRPAMKPFGADLSAYDVIYIGFPIWWGIEPRVVDTFIESADLSGKKIVIFATSGGSSISYALDHLKKAYPKLNIVGGEMLSGKVTKDIKY